MEPKKKLVTLNEYTLNFWENMNSATTRMAPVSRLSLVQTPLLLRFFPSVAGVILLMI